MTIRPKPLIFFWFSAFVISIFFDFLLIYTWKLFLYNPFFEMLAFLQVPFIYFFFGWLYFRSHDDFRLSRRIEHASAWILLTILGQFILYPYFYSRPSFVVLSSESLILQGINFFALLFSAYIAYRHRIWIQTSLAVSVVSTNLKTSKQKIKSTRKK